ncbi:MAG: TolC family protein [Bacteroidetes bacterium]|nr:MAG: TolC family protein [Bacteroidota bacterium]
MNIIKLTLIIFILISTKLLNAQDTITKVLRLEDAMNIAMGNSPDIQKSRLNMERNKENLNAQLAALKSRFALDVTPIQYSVQEVYNTYFSEWYTEENKMSFGSLIISQPVKQTDGTLVLRNTLSYQDNYSEANSTTYTGFNNNFYIEFNQPLFTYNRTKMNLKRNELSLETATLSYAIQMLSLEQRVTQAFYFIYQKQKTVQISKEEYDNQKISKSIIESKVEADLSAKEELLQAELNLATSKSNYDNSIVDLDNEKDQFKLLIGISIYEDVEVEADIEYKPVIIDLNKAIENSISQRMELRQRQINIDNAEMDIIQSSATNEFRADMNLSLGLMGNNEVFMNVYDKATKSPQAGITFKIPIFDWGERKARIRAAEVELESKKIDKKSEEDNIVLNLRKIFRNLQNLVTQIEIAEKNEKNAQLTYEINLERYRNGDLTSMDLGRFQNQLSEKKANLSNALINHKLELLNMKIQSLWDFENNQSFVPKEFQENIIKD